MKTKCIAVRSVTYAQKAREILKKHNINASLARVPSGIRSGCGWCISVPANQIRTAQSLLQNNGVKITGEIYDLS